MLAELPFFDPIIEDELHVPSYHDLRLGLSHSNKTHLFSEPINMFHPDNIRETAAFVERLLERRHPKRQDEKLKRR